MLQPFVSSSATTASPSTNTNFDSQTSSGSEESALLPPVTKEVTSSTTFASAGETTTMSNNNDSSNILINNGATAITATVNDATIAEAHQTATLQSILHSTHNKAPPSSTGIPSRPSSISSRGSRDGSNINSSTRACINNLANTKPHAYFASSEEESEAELDEKDSHCSSRASTTNQHHHTYHHGGGGHSMSSSKKISQLSKMSSAQIMDDGGGKQRSSLRGSRKLAEIASKVFHSSHVRMTVPDDYKEKGVGVGVGGIPIPKAPSNIPHLSNALSVPLPPSTVTVAVQPAKDNGQKLSGGSPSSILLPSTLKSNPAVALGSSPIRKRIRKNKRRSQKHLPRGLPVFKDPRSCMWTSTHDANAPSEDRYSSLVNVLLRPPKTPRGKPKKMDNGSSGGDKKKHQGNTTNNNNVNVNGEGGEQHTATSSATGGGGITNNGSKSGSIEGTSDDEENTPQQENITSTQSTTPAAVGGGATANNTTPPTNTPGSNSSQMNNNAEDDEDNTSLIRLSLWSVIDGHGGGCVATYAAEVLLPHIAASVARALKSEIVDRGVCNVNGQLRDANALDLDGLIRSSDRSRYGGGKSQVRQREAGIDVVNPNSIHYRSPWEDSESEGDVGVDHLSRRNIDDEEETTSNDHHPGMRSESESEAESEAPVSVASSLLPGNPTTSHGESVSSVKTSVKTVASPVTQHAPIGTHSPAEVASITRAITDSFLAVDEGWINSIDPVTTHQTSCVANGRWNAGACALVVFIVQRLDWCRSSRVDHETHHHERGAGRFEDTAHNKDAARRKKLEYAKKSKSVSSLSTLSSTSSITTEATTTDPNMDTEIGEESEITETEDDDDVSDIFGPRRGRKKRHHHHLSHLDDPHHQDGVCIPTPAGCKCHYYRPHDAMVYTAHVGDCRSVMLGSAPPRTIKVPHESSRESIADEISSSEHDSDSSDDMEDVLHEGAMRSGAGRGRSGVLGYVRRASKRQRRNKEALIEQPFVPLPPLRRESDSEESAIAHGILVDVNNLSEEEKLLETEDEGATRGSTQVDVDRPPSPTQLVADPVYPPPLPLSMQMRPIDLTTDHSAYNPAEVTAVLRRCNNAPKAISSASSGGIKRVAGSLAVTRALGDAYLKCPRLSFFPYKRHAPYITGRPEVNCRVLTKGEDRIITLASDGVWERASGDDVLRWVRNYYNARIAGVEEDQHLAQPHVYDDNENSISRSRTSRKSFEDVLGSDGNDTVTAVASVGSIEEISSEEDVEKPTALTSPPSFDSVVAKNPAEHDPALTTGGANTKVEEFDAATAATITTADDSGRTSATAKVGSKRKHPESAAADDSASCRSASTPSFGLGTAMTSSIRHSRSSSRSPYHSIPTVSEVIVRKVLNKVRKTRNISSLRMLMSLPKGRARRSKHDDITATVVDLSGFVS